VSLFTAERRVGHLVEARIFRLATVADVAAYGRAFTPAMLAGHPTLVADHRPVTIYSQPVAAGLMEMFTSLNATWHRVAILIAPTNSTLSLQLQRVVRGAHNPSRRVFLDEAAACAFLGETLQPLEVARLAAFLAQPPSSARGSAEGGTRNS
jgi:hypothetical protein